MKYRFIGETTFGLINGFEYPFDFICNGFKVQELSRLYPSEWELVKEKPLHKDTDLGYFAIEIIKSAISISPFQKPNPESTNELFISYAIGLAQELIKQLNEETK